jgi:hypothetical protein
MIKYRIMTNTKRLFGFMLTAFFIVSAVMAQDAGGRTSTGNNRPDLMSFKGIYSTDGLELRKKTLKDISEAVANGDTSDDIYAALDYMAKEGINNKAMIKGQLQNDYPDIRRQVAIQLGKIGTPKAADILIQMCDPADKDLYVLLETIKALGNIGINENDHTIKRIFGCVRGLNERPLDNIVIENLISSSIDAFDKLEKKSNGIKDRGVFSDITGFMDKVSKNERFTRRQGQVSVSEHAKLVMDEMLRRDAQRRQGT